VAVVHFTLLFIDLYLAFANCVGCLNVWLHWPMIFILLVDLRQTFAGIKYRWEKKIHEYLTSQPKILLFCKIFWILVPVC